MAPFLRHGEEVLADPAAYVHHLPTAGDIVVARHPFRADVLVIKRVIGEAGDGSYELRGDNPTESTDSRDFGLVRHELILGRVVSRCPAVRFGSR